ncbi:MAG TPA: LamG domain-containing protein [Kofleriaceae bacterium]|nr:LamG domain-containing protein [Kofleriaceae bacterium]
MLLAAMLLAGCKQSLFDSHNGDDGTAIDGNGSGSGDGSVQSTCGAMCLGDAAADFGTAKWQYFDDHRDRSWAPMTAMGSTTFVGADPANKIMQGSGSLLVSTSGMTSGADPAIAWTSSSKQVIKLSLRVTIPAGAADQTVWLYRNAREDVLFSQAGTAGNTVETSITVDAFVGDRFLLAVAPTSTGATDVSVQFFVNGTGMAFPHECLMGMQFTGPAPTTPMMENVCGAAFISRLYDSTSGTVTDVAPTYTAGPFPELGMAGDIALDHYYKGADVLNRMGDSTTQFWMREDAYGTENAVIFSDVDLDATGGLEVYRLMADGRLGAQTCTLATMTTLDFAYAAGPYPAPDTGWHFVRVVHTNGSVKICVDGTRTASYVLAAGKMQSTYPPSIGKNVIWTPAGAYYDGAIDDVRVLSTALPCN